MATTYDELKGKTVAELREIAKGLSHEAVQGYSQMHKEQLLPALCRALGIDAREHHKIVGVDKAALKAQMRALKKERNDALAAHDSERLRVIRQKYHRLNHQIRAHTA